MKFNPRRFRNYKKVSKNNRQWGSRLTTLPAQQKREALPKTTFDALLKDNDFNG